jgi:hypothetical protein
MSLVSAPKCGDFPKSLASPANSSQSLSCPFPICTTCLHGSNMKNMDNSSDWKREPWSCHVAWPFQNNAIQVLSIRYNSINVQILPSTTEFGFKGKLHEKVFQIVMVEIPKSVISQCRIYRHPYFKPEAQRT